MENDYEIAGDHFRVAFLVSQLFNAVSFKVTICFDCTRIQVALEV